MPCVLTLTGSVGPASRPHRQLAVVTKAEGGNIPPRRRGRSWGRGHRRTQAPSPARPDAPKLTDPSQGFLKHLQDAASTQAAPAHLDALTAIFPDRTTSIASSTASSADVNAAVLLQQQYTAALDTLALFCPASPATVDLGGTDWQAPASPGLVSSASLRDLVEAARLSAAAPAATPGTVTHHDAAIVRKLGLGSCNLPEPLPHPSTLPHRHLPAAPRRRLPPTPAQNPAAYPTPAARLRCGALRPTPSPPSAPSALATPRTTTPLRSGGAPAPPAASRLRSLSHAAPHPGLGAARPQSPARASACPTAAPTAAVCGPRRRVISEAISSSMRGLLAPTTPTPAPTPDTLRPLHTLSLNAAAHHAHASPASSDDTPPHAPPSTPKARAPLAPAARLVAEHLGLGGQALSAGDEARLVVVLESFDALSGSGFVPQHVGPQQYSSWLVRRSAAASGADVWHSAVKCALAPLVQ